MRVITPRCTSSNVYAGDRKKQLGKRNFIGLASLRCLVQREIGPCQGRPISRRLNIWAKHLQIWPSNGAPKALSAAARSTKKLSWRRTGWKTTWPNYKYKKRSDSYSVTDNLIRNAGDGFLYVHAAAWFVIRPSVLLIIYTCMTSKTVTAAL